MKKKLSLLLALVLAVSLCLSLGVGAAAAGVTTVTAPVGSYLRALVDVPNGETLRSFEILDGEEAPGLAIRAEGEGLALVGTPDREGNWMLHLSVTTDSGKSEIFLEQVIVAADATPVPTATPAPEVTFTPAPTAAPTAEPTLAPTPAGLPVITKNPTGEMVSEGGTAIFVARADEADSMEWYLADNVGGTPVEITQAAAAVSGLQVYGQGTETLTLSGIPASLNGWQVECRFTGNTGAVAVSTRAAITVRTGGLPAPVITLQPEGAELYAGETSTLATRASVPADGSLHYQWYSTDKYDLATVRAIEGAEDSTYTPPTDEGTVYYCVGIRNVRGAEESTTAYSRLVEVTCHSTVREHFHDFTGPWHWDELHHWRECSCGMRQEESYHDFQWTVTKKATSKTEGERVGVCTVCSFETTETVPAGSGGNTGLVRTLMIVLLVLVALLLVGGAVFMVLRSRGGNGSRPPRDGGYSGTYNGTDGRRTPK